MVIPFIYHLMICFSYHLYTIIFRLVNGYIYHFRLVVLFINASQMGESISNLWSQWDDFLG